MKLYEEALNVELQLLLGKTGEEFEVLWQKRGFQFSQKDSCTFRHQVEHLNQKKWKKWRKSSHTRVENACWAIAWNNIKLKIFRPFVWLWDGASLCTKKKWWRKAKSFLKTTSKSPLPTPNLVIVLKLSTAKFEQCVGGRVAEELAASSNKSKEISLFSWPYYWVFARKQQTLPRA